MLSEFSIDFPRIAPNQAETAMKNAQHEQVRQPAAVLRIREGR